MPTYDVFTIVRKWLDGSEPAHAPSERISSSGGLMPPLNADDPVAQYWRFWKADGKEFPDGVYHPRKGQRVRAAYIYCEPENDGGECVRWRLDEASSAASTAAVLVAAARGALRALEVWIEGADWERPAEYRWVDVPGDEMSSSPQAQERNDLGFIMGWQGEEFFFV